MHLPRSGPGNPAGNRAKRRPGSIRRTTSISTVWPEGRGEAMLMTGEARDLITLVDGGTRIAAEGFFEILSSQRREILAITTRPDIAALQRLVGQRAGANLRLAIGAVIPEQKAAGSALYQLLDDFCGASLVASWVWSVWNPEWMRGEIANGTRRRTMEGVCIGFATGSSSLNADGSSRMARNFIEVPEISDPGDPIGWHEMLPQSGTAVRRLRRIDVWREQSRLHAEAHFQDSATTPAGGRVAVHEYLLTASADAATGLLLDLQMDPRILPFHECPGAVPHAANMLGQQLPDFRLAVLKSMPGTQGCTHLNDMLRALADAPALAEMLGETR